MRQAGLQGAIRGKKSGRTTILTAGRACSRSGRPRLQGAGAEPALGERFHGCRDLVGCRLRGVRDRRTDRRLEGRHNHEDEPRPGHSGDGALGPRHTGSPSQTGSSCTRMPAVNTRALRLNEAPHRRWRRSLGGLRRGRLRQCPRRVHDRPVQNRAHPPSRALEDDRPRRARDPQMSRLVQPKAPTRSPQQAPARRVRASERDREPNRNRLQHPRAVHRDRVRGLVCVPPNHDHAVVPFQLGIAIDRIPVDIAQLGRYHGPIRSGQGSTGGGERHNANRSDRRRQQGESQLAANPNSNDPAGQHRINSNLSLSQGAASEGSAGGRRWCSRPCRRMTSATLAGSGGPPGVDASTSWISRK